jgi:hypothetical protein
MMKKRYFYGFAAIVTAIVVIAIIGIGVTSCSGPEGPMGPEGPQGPAGSTGSGQDGSDGQDGQDGRPATPVVVYTITFDSNEGSAIDPEKLMRGGKVTKPEHPTREFTHEQIFVEGAGLYRTGAGSGWIFLGWFLNGEPYDFNASVTTDITLTAQWAMPGKISTDSDGIDAVPTNADFFDKALAFVVDNPASYYLVINQDYTSDSAKSATATGIALTIIGIGSERTITANPINGVLFNINNGAQLYLENNITLKGRATSTNSSLISITDGTLNMNDGSKITGYTTGNNEAGMIYVSGTTASFVMNGGEISGNQSTNTGTNGSGIVKIYGGATFTMNDGTIKGNTVASSMAACIYVQGSSNIISYFIMNGGTITGNTNTNANCGTGGVYINNSSIFRIEDGSITNNTANATTGANNRNGAGGVYIHNYSGQISVLLYGGSITGNISPMGDIYYNTTANRTFNLYRNATIGTMTVLSYTDLPLVTVSKNVNYSWTGSVQVLNLYLDNTNFTTVANAFIDKQIIRAIGGNELTSADIDKVKKFNFLNSNLVEQDISLQGKGIVKSGAKIGYMTP